MIEPLEERALMSAYYVSPSGNDSNKGTSTSSAWKSIGKVNSVHFNAGDTISFQGGKTFYGTLNLSSKDAGTGSDPVTFESYNGQATINSGKGTGAFVENASGVWFNNLNFAGTPGSSPQSGIDFEGYTTTYYTNDKIENCTITGYELAGVLIEESHSNGGFSGMQITGNSIHDNVDSGIQSAGPANTSLTGLLISYNQIYNNYGDGHSACTGSGVMLGDVSNTVVEYNSAYLNGSKGGEGGVGIWAYSSNNVTFQYNESYDNVTTRGMDGDGFDFDADVSNSVIQYNYAFGNDGTGAQLDQWMHDNTFTNDIVRYNVFQDNGRKNNYGNLEVWGKVLNSYLYNNTIYTTPGGNNSAIRVHNSTIPGMYVNNVHFVDNIIETTGGAPLINVPSGETQGAVDLTFTGNVYWTNGSTPKFTWGSKTFTSLSQWQSFGQETWKGKKVGLFTNPGLQAAGTGSVVSVTDLPSLTAYTLSSSSALANQGLNITAMYGVAAPTVDFYGDKLATTAAAIAGADQTK